LAEITLGAYKDMGLQEGDIIYCLIKTHAIAYLAELDFQSAQQIISHDNRLYLLDKLSPL
jgi:molybdate transport system ATP-binding protein